MNRVIGVTTGAMGVSDNQPMFFIRVQAFHKEINHMQKELLYRNRSEDLCTISSVGSS